MSSPSRPDELRTERWTKLEEIVDRFEAAWQRGERPSIAEFLTADVADRRELLVELVHAELELRIKGGDAARVEQYLSQFPELTNERSTVLDLIAVEFKLRQRGQPNLSSVEFCQRFPEHSTVLGTLLQTTPAASPESQATLHYRTVGNRSGITLSQSPLSPDDATAASERSRPTKGSATDSAGRELPRWFGGYVLLEEIARGGMGVVYKARQANLNRTVALKMLLAGQFAGADELERFRREAEGAAQLRHANIVAIHEVGRIDGQPYFSMDYVEGPNLATLVRENPLSAIEAAKIVKTLAEAIHYAHERGILHRDLKPSNILIQSGGQRAESGGPDSTNPATLDAHRHPSRSGSPLSALRAPPLLPVITDFGLMRRMAAGSDLTATGQMLGTPSFMPPEQAEGRWDEVGPASDVYSLGAILYQLITGRPPFLAASSIETLVQVRTTEPVAPRLLVPRLDRDVETICLKCLQKEPSKRYATAQELSDDLGRFLRREPIRARPVGVTGRLLSWAKRNPRVAQLTAAVFLLLSLVAVSSTIGVIVAAGLAAKARDAQRKTEVALQQSQRHLAQNYIQRGVASCEQGNVASGVVLLHQAFKAAPADDPLRVTARNLLAGWGSSLGSRLLHDGPVNDARFSPDGKTVVTASQDGTAQLWIASTGEPLAGPLKHDDSILAAAFSPDGTRIVTGSVDRTARLWDSATGRLLVEPMRHEGPVGFVAFSPAGDSILTASMDGTARLWDASSGRPIGSPMQHDGPVRAAAFSPDGTRLITGGDDRVARLWDASTGEALTGLAPHEEGVYAVAFSPDGRLVATGSRDGIARLWDATTGDPNSEPLEHNYWVVGLAFSPNGEQLAVASRRGIGRVWQVASGELLFEMKHAGPLNSVAVSPDGTTVVTGSDDRSARVWDATTGRQRGRTIWHDGPVRSAAFSPDGQQLLTASFDGTAVLWNYPLGRPVPLWHDDEVRAVAFTPDGAILCTGCDDFSARLWDTATGKPVGSPLWHDDAVYAVAFSPDGRTVLTGSLDRTARLRDSSTGVPRASPLLHDAPVRAVAFSPDGKTLATACDDGSARLFEAGSDEFRGNVMSHQRKSVLAVAFSPDGKKVLTASTDTTARLWNASTGEPIGPVLKHEMAVSSAAFSRDGTTILTGCFDWTARRWNAITGESRGEPLRHDQHVLAAAFNPDATIVLTGCLDRTARFWDAASSLPRGPILPHNGAVIAVAFSPDGTTAVTAGAEGVAWLWKVAPALPDDLERVALWVAAQTGRYFDDQGVVRSLTVAEWTTRRERLARIGGPPAP